MIAVVFGALLNWTPAVQNQRVDAKNDTALLHNGAIQFAADELTGLIWAAALMRPSKSTKDMELKSLKKKYKSKGFAAGCSREVIQHGADQLGWELDKLLSMTLQAMAASEDTINAEM